MLNIRYCLRLRLFPVVPKLLVTTFLKLGVVINVSETRNI